ncbi:metallophosphoesterase family protein [Candidatus Pacearchaeota archaeon]|nr:metallophosphoesterase family protein [Candidatus Pacearchaeota archaeon]
MKILALGDFHGTFPEKLKGKIAKEKFDVVIGVGDYTGISEWRPYIMKQLRLALKGIQLTPKEYFGKERFRDLLKKDYAAGKKVLNEMNKLKKPTFIVFGNGDWYKYPFDKKIESERKSYEQFVKKLKHLKNINYNKAKFQKINFVGFGGYMDIDAYFDRKKWKEDGIERHEARVNRRTKSRKHFFNILKKTKGEKIFVFHYPPKGAFDIIRDKKDNPMNGKSTGISFFTEAIKRYKPRLVLCGHMHEYQGLKYLHGSPIINPGDAEEGKAAIITLEENKEVKVKFIK